MADTVQETIQREARDIEERKVAMMDSAKALADAANVNALNGRYLTPDYQVAGMSPDQLNALDLGRAGIGAYQPYMTAATNQYGNAGATTQNALDILGGADTRGQFGAAQALMNTSSKADLAASQAGMQQGIGALYAGSNAGPASTATGQGYTATSAGSQGYTAAQSAAINAVAAQLGVPPSAVAAQFKGPQDISSTNVSSGAPLTAFQMQAAQSQYAPAISQYGMAAAPNVSTKSFTDRGTAASYMSPYMQQVVDAQQQEAQREADIAGQAQQAQAARSGAFGGSRDAIMRSEAARNLATQKGNIQTQGLQNAFQQAQQQFNAEQGIGLQGQVANQQAGLTVGQQNLGAQLGTQQLGINTGLQIQLANLSNSQQAAVQNQASQLQAQGMSSTQALQAALANQSSGLQAAQANQGMAFNTAAQNAQLAQQTALANQSMQGQYGLTQGQMTQAANMQTSAQAQQAALQNAVATSQASQFGAAAGNQAALQNAAAANQASQFGAAAGNQASLANAASQNQMAQYNANALQQAGLGQISASNQLGQQQIQQAGLGQSAAQGIGALATSQFGIGNQLAQGIGALGQQQGNLATQGAALGQAAQGMGQQDVNFQYNLGAAQQKQLQSELDASRQNELTQNMQPYQQMGFVSDIYRGAPSSQMAVTTQSQATPSPFMQAAGLGIGAVSAAAAAGRAGII